MLSARAARLKESATIKVSGAAKRMIAEGVDVINLSMGEPDYNTPEHIKQAAHAAIDANHTHYTINRGIPALREAVCRRLKADFNVDYTADQVIVSSGAKQSLFNIIMALVDEGDEVLLPYPAWPTHPEAIGIAGGKVVPLYTDEKSHFKITPRQLEEAITPQSRMLLFSNPVNPTGMAYNDSEVAALVDVLKKHHLYILSDEIYARLCYDGLAYRSMASFPEIYDRVILVQGVSKAYAMTGWRIGFSCGPAAIMKAADKIQGHSTSNASSIAQYAALAAVDGPQDALDDMLATYAKRRTYIMQRFAAMPGVHYVEPQGAFYLFPNINGVLTDTVDTSEKLALYLLEEAHVAVVPGIGFGAEGFLRISYAASMEQLEEACDRIEKALNKLRKA
ncbi:MAG: pyridoxal phosphate-dependent aminotransferase [Calditrichaeota bacterium]|nr:MAG: pyridoxal phosphate-dependent aminotransferase [Calditrichota bacterium]